MSTETVQTIVAQDGHLNFHIAPSVTDSFLNFYINEPLTKSAKDHGSVKTILLWGGYFEVFLGGGLLKKGFHYSDFFL